MAAIEFDLTGFDPDTFDAGGRIDQKGWYKVIIDDIYKDRKNGESEVFEVLVEEGPFKGCRKMVFFRYPHEATDPQQARDRFFKLAKRMRLHTDEEFRQWAADGKAPSIDFAPLIGQSCWLEMTERKGDDGGKIVDAAYIPFYPLDHERVPPEQRKSIGLEVKDAPAAKEKRTRKSGDDSNGQKAPPNNNDFSDL
jgi:hypothetical protein